MGFPPLNSPSYIIGQSFKWKKCFPNKSSPMVQSRWWTRIGKESREIRGNFSSQFWRSRGGSRGLGRWRLPLTAESLRAVCSLHICFDQVNRFLTIFLKIFFTIFCENHCQHSNILILNRIILKIHIVNVLSSNSCPMISLIPPLSLIPCKIPRGLRGWAIPSRCSRKCLADGRWSRKCLPLLPMYRWQMVAWLANDCTEPTLRAVCDSDTKWQESACLVLENKSQKSPEGERTRPRRPVGLRSVSETQQPASKF